MAKKKKLAKVIGSLDDLYSKYNDYTPIEEFSEDNPDIERLDTPFASMHRYLGGGPAMGKVTTYAGFNSTGKTSLALEVAAYNKDKTIGFIDCEFNWVESSYDWVREYFGIERDRIHVLQPDFLEQGANMIADMCNIVDIIIYDGFDSIPPLAEFSTDMPEKQIGEMARAYKKFFRKTMGRIYRTKTAVIITNHLYENIGNNFEKLKEPGGHAIADYASQKLWLTRSNDKDADGTTVIGQNVNCRVKKDKLSGNRESRFSLLYNNETGFNAMDDLITNAIDLNIIEQAGSWYKYDGTTLGQGRRPVEVFLKDNPGLIEEFLTKIKSNEKESK